VLGIANVDPGHGAIHVIAELTLIAARMGECELNTPVSEMPLREGLNVQR